MSSSSSFFSWSLRSLFFFLLLFLLLLFLLFLLFLFVKWLHWSFSQPNEFMLGPVFCLFFFSWPLSFRRPRLCSDVYIAKLPLRFDFLPVHVYSTTATRTTTKGLWVEATTLNEKGLGVGSGGGRVVRSRSFHFSAVRIYSNTRKPESRNGSWKTPSTDLGSKRPRKRAKKIDKKQAKEDRKSGFSQRKTELRWKRCQWWRKWKSSSSPPCC